MVPHSFVGAYSEGDSHILWEDGERVFRRGWRQDDGGQRRAVMIVQPAADHPSRLSLERLTHEYELKDQLDGAWAVRPLDLVHDAGRTVLVLEDVDGEPLDRLLGVPIEVRHFLGLAIALAAAMGRLHQCSLVHKDIKPANILVNGATGEVRLTGFGIASRLVRERQSPHPPETIAGTLAYMAPEQTGRMNRSIDSRSDLYALGVTFYQMLTGTLPFTAADPMEWVHCHLARRPVAPAERLREIPGILSAIVMKLLAKRAEDRYQTAAGLESDLRRCQIEWKAHRRIDDFPLGEHDTPEGLLIPEKLYGRRHEVATLLAAFDRVVQGGAPELVLVSGYSGIGKSSVVNELQPVLVPPRALFASGKFDQYKRDIPYSTLAQAFQSLIRPLLGKTEADLAPWRDALRQMLGPNAGLIVDLVPELKFIIGEPPAVPELPPQDAQRRFQLVFRRFLAVFASPEHPLALFLDDLQWLDAATLDLLEDLLTHPDVRHVLLIGAYRDNEVDLAHPLMHTLDRIRSAGAPVQNIVLAPLAREDVGLLVAEALFCDRERAAPLAELVHAKTAGNPFFVIQFLSELVEEELITFDHHVPSWSWDLARIHAKGYTDNVVDLMVAKLNRLPVNTQKALQQLACLGNRAELALVSAVAGDSKDELQGALHEALRTGLVLHSEGSYRFLHDRVQQAAYSLIPEAQRADAHLRIGRLLVTHTPPEQHEETIFEIVNQLNRGASLITSQFEKEQLAEFNLTAGRRAKASTAYVSALTYLVAGRALLSDDGWEQRPDMMFTLELHRAECEFLTGELEAAEARLTVLSSRAANVVNRAAVACLRSDLYTALNRTDLAVDVCLAYLGDLGIVWSAHPTEQEARREYERMLSLLGDRAIEDLIDLPLMDTPESAATLEVLARTLTPAVSTDANLFSLLLWRMVNLSIEHGNTDASCYAYVHVATIAGLRFGNYQAGFRFGQLGYNLVERRGLTRFEARTYLAFAVFVASWTRHVRTGQDLLRRALDAANSVGDVQYATFSWHNLIGNFLAAGAPLADVQREAERGLEFVRKSRFEWVMVNILTQLALVRTLHGSTKTFGCFDGEHFDEPEFERYLASEPGLVFSECWYWVRKLQARFFAGDYAAALAASANAQRLLWTSPSFLEMAEAHFYGALSHAASCDASFPLQYQGHVEALTDHYKQLMEWAENCPENFENRVKLVGAEIARIEGRELDAERLYEAAIKSARENEFVHNEALANELAARFHTSRGRETIANARLREARHCYLRWGADGKVRQLEALFPFLRGPESGRVAATKIAAPIEHLDHATVVKVSQAVSGEAALESLIDTPMRAGAYVDNDTQIFWEDGERVFRRGWRLEDEGNRRTVLIVVPAAEYPSRSIIDRLTHEYDLRDELDGAWAVRPLELLRDAGRTALVLEDVDGEPLDKLLGPPMEVGRFSSLAIAIAAAMGKLHQHGLVHKDIKPANILVNATTGEVRLTGFGIATRLARERQSPHPPETIAGTLAYMAPEQTGRMNRSLDSRSDLYALGVTFYQMLTGALPFTAADPMEWVHCHLARQPVAPAERLGEIPEVISAIVTKLLAKRAEDRYQTAAGLESDLRRCQIEWKAHRRIDDFPIGERDTSRRLLIPEKLYGRRHEVETLLTAFDRVVKGGAPELVLVSGYSGIGKSSVVNELQPVLVLPRALFASGKFDQYKRDIPYSTLAQAFQSLIHPLLAKGVVELGDWREALRDSLGPNAQLMVDLVPELKLIIGEQSSVPELPPQDSQRRFQLVFRRFLSVFAKPEHPLTLFLDDLQWLDAATLDLLEDLLTHPDVRHLLLIGAYRDNEVAAAHPLMRKLEAIRATGRVRDIKLGPLTADHLAELVADTLRITAEQAAPLAELVRAKTDGNPLFVIQFLHLLAEEGLLVLDHKQARWSFDLGGIHAKKYTDNVVELLAAKLTRLPLDTQDALRRFACLGNVADVAMLSIVLGRPEEQVHADLWEAQSQQLIERLDRSYQFVHDRVQEAAYALISKESRVEAHLAIGRLLAAHTPPEKRDAAIFEIVNQLNRGAQLITSVEEREQLAELNLAAGKRAKASAAYASALKYLSSGAAVLPKDTWDRRQELAFELELHPADCEICSGSLQAAERRLEMLAARAADTVQRCAVARRRVDLYTMLGASDRAVAAGLECLRYVGIDCPAHPTKVQAIAEYERVWTNLGSRAIEDLVELPLMNDAESLATLDVLTVMTIPTQFTDENLHALIGSRAVNLCLERGNSDAAPVSYTTLGLIAGTRFGQHDEGYRLGKIACSLIERTGLKHFGGGRAYIHFALLVPWKRPLAEGIDPARRAFQMGKEFGHPTFATLAGRTLISILFASGHPLDRLEREAQEAAEFVLPFGHFLDRISAPLALVRTLRGMTSKFGSLDDGRFTERSFEQRLTGDPTYAFLECYYWIRKLQARFFAGDHASAIDAADKAEKWFEKSAALAQHVSEMADLHFYAALSRAAWCEPIGPGSYAKHREAIQRHEQQLRGWASICPHNFEDRAALVGAEIARIEGRPLDAMDQYERAIASARAGGFVHNEAIGNELAARFYAARGFATIANAYLRGARSCYLRWGADGKVRQLEALFPFLREAGSAHAAATTITVPLEHLDIATVVKVSQAVSGEMVLERLVDTLMRLAIEHAGAERGLLLLSRGNDLHLEAEAKTGRNGIIVRPRDQSAAALPDSIVHYVLRSREIVILADALAHPTYSSDSYIREHRARSILCLPLVSESKLTGVLYLENNLTPDVFTPDRITVLKVLASQAAISLENSRLYRDLADREAKIRRLVDANIMGICIWKLEGGIVAANEEFLRMLQHNREDVVSGRLRWTDLTPPELRELDERAVAELRSTGTFRPYEKEFFRKDGSRMPVLIGGALVENGGSEGVAFVLDLTERKRAEQALRELQSDFAHMNRVSTMGELAASLAHEILHPIATARNNARAGIRFLEMSPPNLDAVRKTLDYVVRDADRAKDIVGRMRDHVKKAPPRRESFDLNEAVREVMVMVRDVVAKNRIAVITHFVDGVVAVQGDRIQLQQVVMNLVLNAAEAMSSSERGSRELSIGIGQGRTDGGVLVEIRDTGPGIDPGNLDRVFEPFYTTKTSGIGMGLSICRSIIDGHGGQLSVSANDPQGAVFQFTLPAAQQES